MLNYFNSATLLSVHPSDYFTSYSCFITKTFISKVFPRTNTHTHTHKKLCTTRKNKILVMTIYNKYVNRFWYKREALWIVCYVAFPFRSLILFLLSSCQNSSLILFPIYLWGSVWGDERADRYDEIAWDRCNNTINKDPQ